MLRASLLAAAAALALSACEGGEVFLPPPAFTSVWAGAAWQGEGGAARWRDSLTVSGSLRGPGTSGREELWVRIVVPDGGVGTYPLEGDAAAVRYLLGGDMIVATYLAAPGGSGELHLDEVTEHVVRGRVTFDAVWSGGSAPAGQGARFEGTFHATLLRPEPGGS